MRVEKAAKEEEVGEVAEDVTVFSRTEIGARGARVAVRGVTRERLVEPKARVNEVAKGVILVVVTRRATVVAARIIYV